MDARIPLLLSALLTGSPGMSHAAPSSAPMPCAAPEHRQFDGGDSWTTSFRGHYRRKHNG